MKNNIVVCLILFICSSINAQSEYEQCLEGCNTAENSCRNSANASFTTCTNRCYMSEFQLDDESYPSLYYYNYCEQVCQESLEEALGQCMFFSDECRTICKQNSVCDVCPEGFTFDENDAVCYKNLNLADGYEQIENYDWRRVGKDCSISTDNNCCPEGYRLRTIDCAEPQMSVDCRDRIRDLEDEIALVLAQGDYNDAGYLANKIIEIEEDEDCYILDLSECSECVLRFGSFEILEVNQDHIIVEPECR